MNFYNPLSNIPDDWDYDDDFHGSAAAYHFQEAASAIEFIKKTNPELAKAVADAIMHGLLAANAYNHDMFVRSYPEGEDVLTRIKKNR